MRPSALLIGAVDVSNSHKNRKSREIKYFAFSFPKIVHSPWFERGVLVSWLMLVLNRFATPSLTDDVDPELEQELRTFACQILFQTGCLLRLSAVTISTAQTLLHRFYFVK
jgi:hypothetical protein